MEESCEKSCGRRFFFFFFVRPTTPTRAGNLLHPTCQSADLNPLYINLRKRARGLVLIYYRKKKKKKSIIEESVGRRKQVTNLSLNSCSKKNLNVLGIWDDRFIISTNSLKSYSAAGRIIHCLSRVVPNEEDGLKNV